MSLEGMAVTPTINKLVEKGWHIKMMTDYTQPEPCWRVWLSWRKGQMPHKEESGRVVSLEQAAMWLETTAAAWHHGD